MKEVGDALGYFVILLFIAFWTMDDLRGAVVHAIDPAACQVGK